MHKGLLYDQGGMIDLPRMDDPGKNVCSCVCMPDCDQHTCKMKEYDKAICDRAAMSMNSVAPQLLPCKGMVDLGDEADCCQGRAHVSEEVLARASEIGVVRPASICPKTL